MIKKIKEIDNRIMNFIEKRFINKRLDSIMKVITFLGDYGLVWLTLILYLLFNNYNVQAKAIITSLIITIFANELVLKNVFKRKRPAHSNKYENIIIDIPKSFSFPSGHTATAFSVVPIAFSKCTTGVATISLVAALLIASSRVYLKVHYVTDVLVGAMLGSAISISVLGYMF